MTQIHILIADDNNLFRHGLRLVLSEIADFMVVGEAANGKDAYNMVFDTVPNVVLLKWQTPIMGGFAAAELIQRDMASTKTLIMASEPMTTSVISRLDMAGYRLTN